MAAERKKELIFILPAYRLCTAAGAGAVKFRGRVRTQEAHERPTDHHCYMYEYHTAAAVVVPFIFHVDTTTAAGNMILEGTNAQRPGLASRAKLEKFKYVLLPVAVSRYEHLRVLVLLVLLYL